MVRKSESHRETLRVGVLLGSPVEIPDDSHYQPPGLSREEPSVLSAQARELPRR